MPLKMPNSMEECLYFTNRSLDKGSIIAWVYKKVCPKCKKAKMGKPVEKGKIKMRATEYVCPNCGYSEEKKAHEESLMLEAQYACPKCGREGESTAEYKHKSFQGIPAFIITCQHCSEKIALTKKMKKLKGKKKGADEDLDDDEI